jgi:hypothetical protein
MSRCVLDDEERQIEVVIGWDPGAETFFARIYDRNKGIAARKAGATEIEMEEAGLVLWTGGFDRIYVEPDLLIAAIRPYAQPFNAEILRDELIQDQASNEGDRNYSVVGDEVEEY